MIISDSQYSGRISGLLAEETGLATYQMDSGVSGEYEKDAWLDAMRGNLETLRGGINYAENQTENVRQSLHEN